MSTPTNFIDYLEHCGGSERFEFWMRKDDKLVKDKSGKPIPDLQAAYDYACKLREQHPDLEIESRNNVVRVKIAAMSEKLS